MRPYRERSLIMLEPKHQDKMCRGAIVFLLMQGFGGLIWWLGILSIPGWRVPFLAPAAPDATLLALAPGDLLFYLAGSFLSAWGLRQQRPWAWTVLCLHTGAACYGALYALSLFLLSGGGSLGAVLMAPSLLVLPALVWGLRPPYLRRKEN